MFTHPEYDGHEAVLHAHDPLTGLKAIVALHNTRLGPAFGGCRMYPYADPAQALTDALRLSRGMTYKAAICELPYGGGKSVVLADPRRDKTPELLRAMGGVIEGQGGRYITADDVGTTLADLTVMREVTRHTAGATAAAQEPLAVTAYGVLMAIEAAVRHYYQRPDLEGLHFAVQGLGNVGYPLCEHLRARGAKLTVSDVDPARTERAYRDLQAEVVGPEAIYDQPVDVFAPCALGAVLNDRTIPHLRVRLVCGGANNQLADNHHDAMLAARGIAYVPDYLANAGGVIDFYQESIDDSPAAVLRSVERIRDITGSVLARAAATGETPLQVADRIVRDRIRAAA
ncbi:MAG: Leu/Phe/Val dehydrogenase [Geminicoccaceae bacterium]